MKIFAKGAHGSKMLDKYPDDVYVNRKPSYFALRNAATAHRSSHYLDNFCDDYVEAEAVLLGLRQSEPSGSNVAVAATRLNRALSKVQQSAQSHHNRKFPLYSESFQTWTISMPSAVWSTTTHTGFLSGRHWHHALLRKHSIRNPDAVDRIVPGVIPMEMSSVIRVVVYSASSKLSCDPGRGSVDERDRKCCFSVIPSGSKVALAATRQTYI